MLPWLPILRDALDIEFGGRPRVATAATTDADHRPRARSVVIRRIDDDGSLYFVSDARSDKNAQLRHLPYAELVFWLPTPRVQIRLAGRAAVVGRGDHPGLVDEFWAALPGPSRALFAWPAPGLPRPARDDAFILALPASAPAPDNFEVIVVVPDQVEQLELADVPHRRIRWPRETEWQPEDINP